MGRVLGAALAFAIAGIGVARAEMPVLRVAALEGGTRNNFV